MYNETRPVTSTFFPLYLLISPKSENVNPSLNVAAASVDFVEMGTSVTFVLEDLSVDVLVLHDGNTNAMNKKENTIALRFFMHSCFVPEAGL